MPYQIRHLNRAERRVPALISGLSARTFKCLLWIVRGQNPKGNRDTGGACYMTDTPSYLRRNIFPVRRLTANDTPETDESLIVSRCRKVIGNLWDFERPGARKAVHIVLSSPVCLQALQSGAVEPLRHKIIEAADDNSKLQSFRGNFALYRRRLKRTPTLRQLHADRSTRLATNDRFIQKRRFFISSTHASGTRYEPSTSSSFLLPPWKSDPPLSRRKY